MRNTFLLLSFFTLFSLFAQNKNHALGFIENKGQIVNQEGKPNAEVRYLLHTRGLNVQLRQNGFSYDVYEDQNKPGKLQAAGGTDSRLKRAYHRIDIDFENSSKAVQLIAEGKSADYDHYYTAAHAPNGILSVYNFQKVTYRNLYNNIDVVFFLPDDPSKPVEYNFIIHPGGKLTDIKLKINGAKTSLADNKIRMDLRFGPMEEVLPLSWIENGTAKTPVTINYKKIRKNVYGFESTQKYHDKTVVIDPVPIRLWGTYYGGPSEDNGNDICSDTNNNVIISGYTWSSTNIATSGTIIISDEQYYRGAGYIVKFDTNGVRLWGMYYSIAGTTVKTDGNNNIYFSGTDILNDAPNVASPNGHQTVHLGYDDAFLVKLNSSGVREWGTYYGGQRMDQGNDITFDAQNNVYLVGTTTSYENIASPGAYQTALVGTMYDDGYIVKFSPQGVRLWGTYFGGTKDDRLLSCNFSDDGYLYVTGDTRSPDGIATPGTYQPNLTTALTGIIAKFDTNGQRVWGTYFPGDAYARVVKSVIKDNFIYLTGTTTATNSLNSSGTYNPNFIGLPLHNEISSYVAKFNLTTQHLVWGTYFPDFIQDIEVNAGNKIFFTGSTQLFDGIATPGAYATAPQSSDSFLVKLDENGQQIWGTYYGGNSIESVNGADDVCNRMTLDTTGSIYLFGNTMSTSGIATPGAHQGQYSGGYGDVFLAKFRDCMSAPQVSANSPVCVGNTIQLTAAGGTSYSWTGPGGFTSGLPNPTILNATTAHSGQYSCVISGTGGCDGPVSISVTVGDTVKPVPDVTALPTITGDCTTVITTVPTATDACAGSITATTTDPLSYSLPGTYTIHWSYNDGNGNTETQNQTVMITDVALPTLLSPQMFCIQQNATINAISISGQQIKWYDAPTGGSLLAVNTALVNGTVYYASQTIGSCESVRIPVTVHIQDTPAPLGDSTQRFCSGTHPVLNDIVTTAVAVTWYDSAAGTTVLPGTTLLTNGVTYYAAETLNGCESVNRLAVTVHLTNTVNANDYAEIVCDEQGDGLETIDVTAYETSVIADADNYTFEYYRTVSGATNQTNAERITDETAYPLSLGIHTIYVRVTSANGCFKIVSLKITVVAKPVVTIPDLVPLCENSSVTIDAGAGFDSYSWSDGSVSRVLTVTQPGDYSVTVTKNHQGTSCTTVKTVTVAVSNKATIIGVETEDWTETDNTIAIHVNGYGDYVYAIDGVHYQTSNVFTGLANGNYTVYVKDKNGCGIAKKDVLLLMYPKFFTPNGDGYNDTWSIKLSFLEPGFKVSIFDRYGKRITTLNRKAVWDGKYNGRELPSTDYWFVVTRADGKEYRGHFTLKR